MVLGGFTLPFRGLGGFTLPFRALGGIFTYDFWRFRRFNGFIPFSGAKEWFSVEATKSLHFIYIKTR